MLASESVRPAVVQPSGEVGDRLLFVGERIAFREVALAVARGHLAGGGVDVVLASAAGQSYVAGFAGQCRAAVAKAWSTVRPWALCSVMA